MAKQSAHIFSAEWRSWKRCRGVLCDRSMPAKLKAKVYETVVRPATVLYCMVQRPGQQR